MLLRQFSRHHPLDAALRRSRAQGWDASVQWLLSPQGRTLLANARLAAVLTDDVVRDVEIEYLLTEVRKQILLRARELLADAAVRGFTDLLVRQCDLNEYTFYVSDEERRCLAEIAAPCADAPADAHATGNLLRLMALYIPVRDLWNRLPLNAYLDRLAPDAFGQFMRAEVAKLNEERRISTLIETHGKMHDEISRLVTHQYEDNPYPRWSTMNVKPGSRFEQVQAYFSEDALRFSTTSFNVLVAGCATGQQAIRCGVGYGARASVLAIDLSHASLVYAARMAEQYSASNVRFMRSDILALPTQPLRFAIVESTGVLHHMADPLKGWQALVEVLQPGGLMYVGLYSRLGRHQINACRQEIAELRLSGTPDDIRRYRRTLILRYGLQHIWRREEHFPFDRDFFSLSNCRDLLFHVHEHQFTIPQIKECLAHLGLRFYGFVIPPLPPNRLYPRFPDATDLDGWWEVEQSNPETFGHMYEFWCRKEA